jgi:hypothetical protein
LAGYSQTFAEKEELSPAAVKGQIPRAVPIVPALYDKFIEEDKAGRR